MIEGRLSQDYLLFSPQGFTAEVHINQRHKTCTDNPDKRLRDRNAPISNLRNNSKTKYDFYKQLHTAGNYGGNLTSHRLNRISQHQQNSQREKQGRGHSQIQQRITDSPGALRAEKQKNQKRSCRPHDQNRENRPAKFHEHHLSNPPSYPVKLLCPKILSHKDSI